MFDVPPVQPVADILEELRRSQAGGVVFELAEGLPSARHLQLVGAGAGRRSARVDLLARRAGGRVRGRRAAAEPPPARDRRRVAEAAGRARRSGGGVHAAPAGGAALDLPGRVSGSTFRHPEQARSAGDERAAGPAGARAGRRRRPGCLRAARICAPTSGCAHRTIDGPSSSRTSWLRPALASCACCRGHYGQLDQAGVQQVVMDEPPQTEGQDAIVLAPVHYEPLVKAACQARRPAYLYERLAAGGTAGAEVSQRLGIPYIVEHPGFDAMLHEALGGAGSALCGALRPGRRARASSGHGRRRGRVEPEGCAGVARHRRGPRDDRCP